MGEPKLRFKADDGADFSGWEEKTLGELCAPLTYGMNAAATKFDGENRYIRITDIDDETHALLPNDIVSPSGELDDKYLVKRGIFYWQGLAPVQASHFCIIRKTASCFMPAF